MSYCSRLYRLYPHYFLLESVFFERDMELLDKNKIFLTEWIDFWRGRKKNLEKTSSFLSLLHDARLKKTLEHALH